MSIVMGIISCFTEKIHKNAVIGCQIEEKTVCRFYKKTGSRSALSR